uniref:Uncharacterized protein n=1 Tax=Cannabis sativa TaxID=3483 RepID=A0A803Q0X1_CANSA
MKREALFYAPVKRFENRLCFKDCSVSSPYMRKSYRCNDTSLTIANYSTKTCFNVVMQGSHIRIKLEKATKGRGESMCCGSRIGFGVWCAMGSSCSFVFCQTKEEEWPRVQLIWAGGFQGTPSVGRLWVVALCDNSLAMGEFSATVGDDRSPPEPQKVKPLSKGVIRAVGGSLESCGCLPLHEW